MSSERDPLMRGLANVGDVLAGKYRVDKILGIGGMGMVVAATHLELDQSVALKFMLPAAMESPEASARFLREARAAGKLTSEHICRVIDVGRFESGSPYIVMEYLEGYDLGTMLKRRGPLRISAAVDYMLQACEGLAEAHAQEIVHRDLKPDNLYLSARADGGHIIKVLDFGISKATVTGIATRTGDILGSPAYMAPEQMRSTKDVDARADVWSIGVVMYQLLTGRLPFSGDTLPRLCLSVLNDEAVPPIEIRQDMPEGLSAAILRCLSKDPEDRYADVGALAEALGPYASPSGVGSVTRVRSALKGRQAPPDPSQTIPQGFLAQGAAAASPGGGAAVTQGLVPPTLHGTRSDLQGETHDAAASDLFAPRLPSSSAAMTSAEGPRAIGITTLTAGTGESVELPVQPRSRFPVGIVGGLCAAIGLVLVLIVLVVRSGGDGGTDAAAPPHAATQPASEAPRPPPPKVTPIDDVDPPAPGSAVGTAPAGDPPVAPEGEHSAKTAHAGSAAAPIAPKAGAGRPRWQPGRPRPKTGKGAGKDDSDVIITDDPTPPPGPDAGDDEDKWGRMHHDQPKQDGDKGSAAKDKAP